MKTRTKLILFISTVVFLSCQSNHQKTNIVKDINDTSRVLRILLDSAIIGHHIPDKSHLYKNNPFGDSIILADDSILKIFLPQVDTLKFKLLTRDQICHLATINQDTFNFFPNFLILQHFKKNQSTYTVTLRNTCVIPMYNKNGKPYPKIWKEI